MSGEEQSAHDRNFDLLDEAASSLETTLERVSAAEGVKTLREKEAALRAAEADLARARGRGYLYAADTEFLIGDAKAAFPSALQNAEAVYAQSRATLSQEASAVLARGRALAEGDLTYAEGEVAWISAEADRLAQAVEGLSAQAEAASGDFINLVDEVLASVKRATFTLDLLESATFKLLPHEDILFSLNAVYRDAPGKGKVKGALFFTNQRVRFELRDEIVTERKLLVFASKKELVKELLLDEPLGKLVASDDVQEGVIFKDQILRFGWAQGVRCPIKTEFELLDGEDAKAWDGIVELIRTGVLEQTRVQTAPPVPVYTFPTDCQGCGAPLPATVKGQTIAKCTFCKRDHLGVTT